MRRMLAAWDRALHGLLACPRCHAPLTAVGSGYRCSGCGAAYPIIGGIPVFADEQAIEHDELDHGHSHAGPSHPRLGDPPTLDAHKRAQAGYFDRAAEAEFEIERPTGAPELYRFMLVEKFRRAVEPISRDLHGSTALTVCGGSGMDAEFLAGAGAIAISSDISLGAAQRAAERARRHGAKIVSIVADVERLPFADRSVDLVYVHDGLHHLADPSAGLDEMMRIARRWVSINEPSRATVTRLAIRLGLALSREESGNVVARLDQSAVCRHLESGGFRVLGAGRYAMYYGHHPGRLSAVLSHVRLLRPAMWAWRTANLLVGGIGNKLSIVAERRVL